MEILPGKPVPGPRFEPDTSQIRSRTEATAVLHKSHGYVQPNAAVDETRYARKGADTLNTRLAEPWLSGGCCMF
jgi:hypothetical protein